ncbi:MAG: TIGR03086 family metal-binding protein [Jiangellaceae bacterium]
MDDARTAGLSLLERATSYCLGSLSMITPDVLPRTTPCTAWDLKALLRHMNDSLVALCEAVAVGAVGADVPPEPERWPDDVLVRLRDNACRLLGAWTDTAGPESVSIAGQRLPAVIVAGTGALEIAVHGWDVARTCGDVRPIPAGLAEALLDLAPLIVTDADRPARFGTPVRVPPTAAAGARLVAFLGRKP